MTGYSDASDVDCFSVSPVAGDSLGCLDSAVAETITLLRGRNVSGCLGGRPRGRPVFDVRFRGTVSALDARGVASGICGMDGTMSMGDSTFISGCGDADGGAGVGAAEGVGGCGTTCNAAGSTIASARVELRDI